MKIYLNINGSIQPFSFEQAKRMLVTGQIPPTTLGRIEGQQDWATLSKVFSNSQSSSLYSSNQQTTESPRKVGCLLLLGIFFIPYICSWITLKQGYSTTLRVVSFLWLGFVVLIGIGGALGDKNQQFTANTTRIQTTPSETPNDKINISKYRRLYMGISYSEARKILGKEGTKSSENKFGDIRTELYEFDCGFMCSITLIFSNDKLTQKSQFGLEE